MTTFFSFDYLTDKRLKKDKDVFSPPVLLFIENSPKHFNSQKLRNLPLKGNGVLLPCENETPN